MATLNKVRDWVRKNGGNGSKYIGGRHVFIDQFRGLRKILGMPTSEQEICDEFNKGHSFTKPAPRLTTPQGF